MKSKAAKDYLEEIEASLAIIKRETESLNTFVHGWQSLAVQLSKLLFPYKDSQRKLQPPLLCRVVSDPYFHPMESPRFGSEIKKQKDRMKYHLCVPWEIQFAPGKMTFRCFDESKPPIELMHWLDQVFIEVDSQPLTIEEFIRIPRNKEGAHSDSHFSKLLDTSKKGLTAVGGETSIPPLPLGLGIIGTYVHKRVTTLLDQVK